MHRCSLERLRVAVVSRLVAKLVGYDGINCVGIVDWIFGGMG